METTNFNCCKRKLFVVVSLKYRYPCVTVGNIPGVYDSLRAILNDGKLDVRVQYMIEVMFAIRKDGFKVCVCMCVGEGWREGVHMLVGSQPLQKSTQQL